MDINVVLETQRSIDGMLLEVSAAKWCTLLEWQHATWSWCGVENADYLEIGTYKGKSASILAHFCEEYGNKLTVVDPEIRAEAKSNLGCISSRIDFIEQRSEQLRFSDYHKENIRNLAFIHVDGMHTHSAVVSDLTVCEELLSDYGIICLDDFHTDLYPQIPAATYHYLSSGISDLSIFSIGFNKAYLCRNTAKPHYLQCVGKYMIYALEALGHKVTIVKTDRNDAFDAYSFVPFQGESIFGDCFPKTA
jgi:hypothetical protein